MPSKKKVLRAMLAVSLLLLAVTFLQIHTNLFGCVNWFCWQYGDCSGEDDCWEQGQEPQWFGPCLFRCYCPNMYGREWLECDIPI